MLKPSYDAVSLYLFVFVCGMIFLVSAISYNSGREAAQARCEAIHAKANRN